MPSTTLLRSLLKNHLNMQQHQLKSSPVSDSASIPIQEATPKQRESWLHLGDNYFPPFRNQSTCAGKGCHGPLAVIALQKTVFFAPVDYCRSLAGGTNVPATLQATKHLPPLLLPGSTVYQENSIALKLISKELTVPCHQLWVISTMHFLEYGTCSPSVFEGEKV